MVFTAHVCSDMKRNKRRNTKKKKSLDRVERGGGMRKQELSGPRMTG